MSKQKVLALDPSTAKTGVSFFIGNKLKHASLIDMDRIQNADKKMWCMCNAIRHVVQEFNPDIVVVEDVQFQGNVQVLIRLARLQGIILYLIASEGKPYEVVSASSWRKSVGIAEGRGIKRETLKASAIQMIKEKYGIAYSEDVCEAICIGLAYLNGCCETAPAKKKKTQTKARKKKNEQ